MNNRYPKSLQDCLDDFKKSWGDLDKLSELKENWRKIIGLELSQQCKPLNIERKVLTIVVNQPQWRQALIYNKHKLKDTINDFGIKLNEIKIIQNYEENNSILKKENTKLVWEKHPSRVRNKEIVTCKLCNSPTPKGEILRWGKCTFCWRKEN